MIKVSFPGKLFLMGEYAVTESGHTGVVMAINRTLEIEARQSEEFVVLSDHGTIRGQELQETNGSMMFVKAAKEISERYLTYKGIPIQPLSLTIHSSLESNGVKYGFGSSGVVVVATIAAILQSHDVNLDSLELFKLSVMAQNIVGGLSSGGDLAAACFGGMIAYTRYDEQWLLRKDMHEMSLIHESWPKLAIKRLDPHVFSIMIGWTGSPNKTQPFVEAFNAIEESYPERYESVLKRCECETWNFINGWMSASFNDIVNAIQSYRELMLEIQELAKIRIETQSLATLISCAESIGYAAKISGSGGGDCGFALTANTDKRKELIDLWKSNGIQYLDLGVSV